MINGMNNVLDINSSCSDASSDEDWGLSCTESMHSILTFALSTVGIYRSARHSMVEQEAIKFISYALRVDGDDGASRRHGGGKL